MKLKILIADDHGVTREGLESILEKTKEFDVTAKAENGREAIKMVRNTRPDIVIMDINMPDLNGTETTRRLLAEFPKIKVIGLSMYSDISYVTGMLKAGARGYLAKSCVVEELVKAVFAVHRGRLYLSEGISEEILEDYIRGQVPVKPTLSAREREVLQLLAEGNKTSQIAERIHVSIKTVESHRKNIMEKLKLYSIAELTKYAIREGLTGLHNY